MLLSFNSVSAQTNSQKSALNFLIAATWFVERCTLLRINDGPYGALLTANGLEPRDLTILGRFPNYAMQARLEVEARTKGVSNLDVCALGLSLYGQNGIGGAKILMQNW